jgi:hypothetical protein
VRSGPAARETTAGADGSFVVDVPLTEGDNPLQVTARGLLGAEAAVDGVSVTRDTQVPIRTVVGAGGPR